MLEALPEPAKNRVRGLILGLLHRWTSKAGSSTARFTATAATTSERQRGRTVAANWAASRRGQQRRAARRERGAGADTRFRSSPSSRPPSPGAS